MNGPGLEPLRDIPHQGLGVERFPKGVAPAKVPHHRLRRWGLYYKAFPRVGREGLGSPDGFANDGLYGIFPEQVFLIAPRLLEC